VLDGWEKGSKVGQVGAKKNASGTIITCFYL